MRSGVKPVFRLTTKLGRRVEATANHPLLTVAAGASSTSSAGRSHRGAAEPPVARAPARRMPDHELVLLAALIADGNLTHRPRASASARTRRSSTTMRAGRGCDAACGSVRRQRHGTRDPQHGRGSRRRTPSPSSAAQHGLWGKRSRAQVRPGRDLRPRQRQQIARFLGVLYACDGHVYAPSACARSATRRSASGSPATSSTCCCGSASSRRSARCQRAGLRGHRQDRPGGARSPARRTSTLPRRGPRSRQDAAQLERVGGLASRAGQDQRRHDPAGGLGARRRGQGRPVWAERQRAPPASRATTTGTSARAASRARCSRDSPRPSTTAELRPRRVRRLVGRDRSIEPLGEQETYDIDGPRRPQLRRQRHHRPQQRADGQLRRERRAGARRRPVALFSLEMSESELAQRFIASQASIKGDDLRKGRVPRRAGRKSWRRRTRLAKSPLFIDDSSDLVGARRPRQGAAAAPAACRRRSG